MRNIILVILAVISINSLQAKEVKERIEVQSEKIESIDISVTSGYFVAVELENEIQGFIPLFTSEFQGIRAQKLNNKTIVIYAYNNNLPRELGKIIITDSNCNKYALRLKEKAKTEKTSDTAIYIKNANKEKKCEALKPNTFPRVGAVMYSNK